MKSHCNFISCSFVKNYLSGTGHCSQYSFGYDFRKTEKQEAKLLMPHDFTDNDKLLYNYTCGDEDVLKMCSLPSPQLNLHDLANEKVLLTKEEEYLNSITNTLRTK